MREILTFYYVNHNRRKLPRGVCRGTPDMPAGGVGQAPTGVGQEQVGDVWQHGGRAVRVLLLSVFCDNSNRYLIVI